MMEKMHQKPSVIYFVKSPLVSWCFDRAVITFGLALEDAVRQATKNCKTEKESEHRAMMTVSKWLGSNLKGQFRDPVTR